MYMYNISGYIYIDVYISEYRGIVDDGDEWVLSQCQWSEGGRQGH